MVYSRKYSRNFIPLKQDSPKHTLDFRPAIGKCLIEIKEGKGKINFYAQGIKPNNNYRLEIMGFNKGELEKVKLSDFKVDEQGKGELKIEFNPDNIDNNSIENFNIVSLMADDNIDDISCALIGYIGSEVSWKDKYKKIKEKYKREDFKQDEFKQDICDTDKFKKDDFTQDNFKQDNFKENDCDLNDFKEDNFKQDNFNNIPKNISNNINTPCDNNTITQKEQGLIDKKEGLVEREKGIIEKQKGIIDKENSENLYVDNNLNKFRQELQNKENGLIQKEKGLLDKEKALIIVESELNKGNLPKENICIREKELYLIKQEQDLIQQEQVLIQQERDIIRKKLDATTHNNLSSEEAGLIQREEGLLDREQGLLDKEKGLIQKEKGLFEIEKSLRYKELNAKSINQDVNIITKNHTYDAYGNDKYKSKNNSDDNNHSKFKNMLEQLKKNIDNINNNNVEDIGLNIGVEDINIKDFNNIEDVNMSDNNIDYNNNISDNNASINSYHNNNNFNNNITSINYIAFNNAKMTPFKEFDEKVTWYRISPYELNSITDKAWTYSNDPFILMCYKKYSHLMLGINDNEFDPTYILALPCQYEKDFEVEVIFKDFKKFIPINNNFNNNFNNNITATNFQENEYGYMILEI